LSILQHIDRQPLEIGQGRLPRAEVVDREPDTQLVQPPNHGIGARRVSEDRVLGDLEREALRRDPRPLEAVRDLARERRVEQLARTDVDGDVDVVAVVSPGPALGEGGLEHVSRQRPDHPGLLRERDELLRLDEAERGVLPAHERLDAADRAGQRGRERLVVDVDLAVLDRPAQIRDDLQALGL
jgi:hypothetical protein